MGVGIGVIEGHRAAQVLVRIGESAHQLHTGREDVSLILRCPEPLIGRAASASCTLVGRQPEDPVVDQHQVRCHLSLEVPPPPDGQVERECGIKGGPSLRQDVRITARAPVELIEAGESVVVRHTAADVEPIGHDASYHPEGVGADRLPPVVCLQHQSEVGEPVVCKLPPHRVVPGEDVAVLLDRGLQIGDLVLDVIDGVLTWIQIPVALRLGHVVLVGERRIEEDLLGEAVGEVATQAPRMAGIGIPIGVKVGGGVPLVVTQLIEDVSPLNGQLRLGAKVPVPSCVGAEVLLLLPLVGCRLHTKWLRKHPIPVLIPDGCR